MSITFTKAYVVNGKTFATLREAQLEGLRSIVSISEGISESILDNKEQVMDILSMKENSRPSARKVNGARKPRKNRVTEPATTTAA